MFIEIQRYDDVFKGFFSLQGDQLNFTRLRELFVVPVYRLHQKLTLSYIYRETVWTNCDIGIGLVVEEFIIFQATLNNSTIQT